MVNIDINKLTTRKGNINSGILATIGKQDRFIVTDIDIDDLVPSEDNFYSLDDIESLKENIEEFGLQQNLTVMRRSDKKYEIISGHRRHEACRLLVQEGKKKFRWLPCRIIPAMSSTIKNILLITMNSETRKKTAAEITEEIERLKVLYVDYKKENPQFKGRVREFIAENLGMSSAHVGRHEKISKNLIPETKEAYKADNINFAAAEELSKLSPEDQKAVYEKTGGKITAKEIKQYQQHKAPETPTEPENMNIDGFEGMPMPKPKSEAPKKPAAVSSERIWAVQNMQEHLEKEIARYSKKLEQARAKENVKAEMMLAAAIEYIGTSLLPKVHGYLFKLKGKDIFKE